MDAISSSLVIRGASQGHQEQPPSQMQTQGPQVHLGKTQHKTPAQLPVHSYRSSQHGGVKAALTRKQRRRSGL